MELDAKRDAVSGSDCLRTKAPFGAVAPRERGSLSAHERARGRWRYARTRRRIMSGLVQPASSRAAAIIAIPMVIFCLTGTPPRRAGRAQRLR